jgi:hypothetical protein
MAHATRQQANDYRKRERWLKRVSQGYRVLRHARRCPECGTENLFWVAQAGCCFACKIKREG